MSDSLGTRLRRKREEQGIALVTIADETKIKVALLEALERDDVTHWPSGIFRRAFIRAYAQAIGLNPDAIVREFLETYPDPEELIAAAIAQAAERAEANAPAGRLRNMMGSALGSLSRLRRSPAADELGFARASPDEAVGTVRRAPIQAEPTTPVAIRIEEPVEAIVPAIESRPEPAPPSIPEPVDVAVDVAVLEAIPVPSMPVEVTRADLDYAAVAHLCTGFARVDSPEQAQTLLERAALVLDAAGVIVWMHDDIANELRPALAHGYSPRVLAQLPPVRPTDDNVTAAAFRTAQLCAVNGAEGSPGALAVPLPTPAGCGGVLALETQNGGEQSLPKRTAATIVAALLGQLLGDRRPRTMEAENPLVAAMPIPFRVMARR